MATTDSGGLVSKEVIVIAAVEIGFGFVEGLLLPNILDGKPWDQWRIPNKKVIAETAITLLITGLASGLIANKLLQKFDGPGNESRRVPIIAGTAIGINVLEALLVPNVVGKKFDADYNLELPTFRAFASSMSVLVVTAVAGGYLSDNIIAAIGSSSSNSGELASTGAPGSLTSVTP